MPDTLPPFLTSQAYADKKSSPVPVQPKPGFLTSEFWLHILALVVPVVYQVFANSTDPALIAGAQVAASVYTLSRTLAKNKATGISADLLGSLTPPATDAKP